MNLTNIIGYFAKLKSLTVNGSSVLTAGDDQNITAAYNFDTSSSGFFGIGDSPDPSSIDPTYGMYVTDQYFLFGAKDIAIGGSLDVNCGATYGYIHTEDGLAFYRSALSMPGDIDIYNEVGDINLNSGPANRVDINGNEANAFESGSNADGDWYIRYNSKGEPVYIEQAVRVITSGLAPDVFDFPIEWPAGFTYKGAFSFSDPTGLMPGQIPVGAWIETLSDSLTYTTLIGDGANPGVLLSGQLDIIFRGSI